MTDTEKKIAEIREELEKATQGPWKIADTTDGYVLLDADDRELAFCDSIGRVDDVRFIANAPEWLRFLLDELEQTRKESNMLREELHKFQELAIKAANHHKSERDKLIEGLRWYGNKSNYVSDYNLPSNITRDRGQRARDILKEIGVTVE